MTDAAAPVPIPAGSGAADHAAGDAPARSARHALRAATAGMHERVDAAFAGFDLADADGYAAFLVAHARALPGIEAALTRPGGLPPLRPRTPLLVADLAALGRVMPDAYPVAAPAGAAEAFGMAYVVEGSRLGGGVLAGRLRRDLPHAYLSATHLPGEWRAFGTALDAAAAGDPSWIAQATRAAERTFALYRRAAAERLLA